MATADARAARERKQKIFVVVGGIALLALLAFQLPRLLGGSSSSTAPALETDVNQAAAPATQTPSRAAVFLVDTDRPLAPAPGKLASFTLFARKNPFVQQVVPVSPAPGQAAGKGKESAEKPSSTGFTVGGSPAALVTVISVNGARQALVPGGAFPAGDPVFVLVSEQPKSKAVRIGIVGGAYAGGAKTTKLTVGKPLVLVNTTTRARYKLVLVAVGNGKSSSAAKPPPKTP